MIDVESYRQLTARYRALNDDELLGLLKQIDGLTSSAQDILRAEISIRRLSTSPKRESVIGEVDISSESDEFGWFADLSPQECIWEFSEIEDAEAAGAMLADADIICQVSISRGDTLDMRPPRIAVHPRDLTRARELLAQTIPEEFRILVRTRDQFVTPTCPRCRAADPLLEAIEPSNLWRCDVCNHSWTDSPTR
jgi:hypothetical protein